MGQRGMRPRVRNSPQTRGSRWQWTRTKRRALEMLLAGATQVRVAIALNLHPNTIWGWTKKPEWAAEARRRTAHEQVITRLRRIHVATRFADVLAVKANEILEGEAHEIDAKRADMFLRQHARYVEVEREMLDGAENMPAVAQVAVNITVDVPATSDNELEAEVARFREYLKTYNPVMVAMGRTPAEAEMELRAREDGLDDAARSALDDEP